MNSLNFLRTIQPFIAVIAVIATASMLVVAIYFTLLDLAWIAFLTGILFAGRPQASDWRLGGLHEQGSEIFTPGCAIPARPARSEEHIGSGDLARAHEYQ